MFQQSFPRPFRLPLMLRRYFIILWLLSWFSFSMVVCFVFGENVVSFFRELCGTMKYHVSRNCLHSLSDLIFMSQSGRRSIAPRQCKQMLQPLCDLNRIYLHMYPHVQIYIRMYIQTYVQTDRKTRLTKAFRRTHTSISTSIH